MSVDNNYDRIAWFYDALSGVVYANALRRAQIDMLHLIPPGSSVLIIGGGTGWILDEITQIHEGGLTITYIESSEKMMEKSKNRMEGENIIHFIQEMIEQTDLPSEGFDIILTPFVLDNFPSRKCKEVMTEISKSLKPNGLWLYADFQLLPKNIWWQRGMLKLMYLFFKVTTRIQTSELPDVEEFFGKYELIENRNYFGEFITARIYRKPA